MNRIFNKRICKTERKITLSQLKHYTGRGFWATLKSTIPTQKEEPWREFGYILMPAIAATTIFYWLLCRSTDDQIKKFNERLNPPPF